jgi:capsid assembly protease
MESEIGLKYTEIYAGSRKIDGTPHAPLTDEARAVYQKMVDQTYDLFVETVARNRGLKSADVRAQQAAIYSGKEAVAAGLADAVLSWDAAWKKVMGTKTIQGGVMKTKLQALFTEAPKETVAQALAELGYVPKMEGVIIPSAHIPALAAGLGITVEQISGDLSKIDFKAANAAAIQAAGDNAKKETLAYVQGINEICALGGQEKMAASLIKAEVKIEDARAKILTAKANGTQRTQILSTTGGMSADAPNPLLADAKKRAGEK